MTSVASTPAAAPSPSPYASITPYLVVRDAPAFLAFCANVFDATETLREVADDGAVRHAELRLGDSVLMVTQEKPQFPDMRGVESWGGSPVSLFVMVDDADARVARALSGGATVLYPLKDAPYGRSGTVRDPFGLQWHITSAPR